MKTTLGTRVDPRTVTHGRCGQVPRNGQKRQGKCQTLCDCKFLTSYAGISYQVSEAIKIREWWAILAKSCALEQVSPTHLITCSSERVYGRAPIYFQYSLAFRGRSTIYSRRLQITLVIKTSTAVVSQIPAVCLVIMSTTQTLSWTKPSASAEEGNWADLITLDLSKFDQPGGKQELAVEFTRAIEEVGTVGLFLRMLSFSSCATHC